MLRSGVLALLLAILLFYQVRSCADNLLSCCYVLTCAFR
jgi:hypothetical protein